MTASPPQPRHRPLAALVLLVLSMASAASLAQAQTNSTQATEQTAATARPLLSLDRVRAKLFTEVMSPALESSAAVTPDPQGNAVDPVNAFNIIWADYEFADGLRALWFQRLPLNLSAPDSSQSWDLTFSDPRVGLRLTDRIKLKGLTSTIDFYAHPGLSEGSRLRGRALELGLQASLSYAIPRSRFTIGAISDFRRSLYDRPGEGASFSGAFVPWTSYSLTERLSTQHWLTLPYRQARGARFADFDWNSPGQPYLQNGIGIALTSRLWTSLLVNNYLLTAPTARNTWLSLWVSTTLL